MEIYILTKKNIRVFFILCHFLENIILLIDLFSTDMGRYSFHIITGGILDPGSPSRIDLKTHVPFFNINRL